MDLPVWIDENCERPEGFTSCVLILLPSTGGEPKWILTLISGCMLRFCRSGDSEEGEEK